MNDDLDPASHAAMTVPGDGEPDHGPETRGHAAHLSWLPASSTGTPKSFPDPPWPMADQGTWGISELQDSAAGT